LQKNVSTEEDHTNILCLRVHDRTKYERFNPNRQEDSWYE